MTASPSSCVLRLFSQPHLHGVLCGLKLQKSQLSIDAAMFPCCEGAGQVSCENTKTIQQCDLRSRLAQLQRLVKNDHTFFDKPMPMPMSAHLNGDMLLELNHISQNQIHKGRIFRTEGNGRFLWPYALAAAWRFGLNVLYVQPGKTFIPKALEDLKAGAEKKQSILMIEPVEKLWEVNILQDFSTLVDFSYNSLIPCWINLDITDLKKKPLSARPKYSEKLAHQRSQDAMDFLPSACKNRLQAMCLGF